MKTCIHCYISVPLKRFWKQYFNWFLLRSKVIYFMCLKIFPEMVPRGFTRCQKNPWHRKGWDPCSRELRCWGPSVGTMNQLNKSAQCEAQRQGEQDFLPLQGLAGYTTTGFLRDIPMCPYRKAPLLSVLAWWASIPYNQPSPNKDNVLHWPLSTYQVPGQYKTHHKIRFYGHRM